MDDWTRHWLNGVAGSCSPFCGMAVRARGEAVGPCVVQEVRSARCASGAGEGCRALRQLAFTCPQLHGPSCVHHQQRDQCRACLDKGSVLARSEPTESATLRIILQAESCHFLLLKCLDPGSGR